MDGRCPFERIKETIMSSTKKLLAAASLAVVSAIGLGTASAAPWDHGRHDGWHDRGWERHGRFEHRAYVDRIHLANALRFRHYRMISDPYFIHGRYVVRTHDRSGRVVFVQVDPYSGAFIREVFL